MSDLNELLNARVAEWESEYADQAEWTDFVHELGLADEEKNV